MQKFFPFILVGYCLILNSCHSGNDNIKSTVSDSAEKVSIFPVTDFLKGQLKAIETSPTTPLKLLKSGGNTDSIWLKREDIRSEAAPFLTPVIDSATMSPLFSEKSFLDQTINAFTFSYDPKVQLPDSIHLTHWDVYINPQSGKVKRLYLVKESTENDNHITTQMTWVTDSWYSIRTITQQTGSKDPIIKEAKVIWNFDN